MTTYIIRRIIQAAIILILVTLMVFLAMRLLPGDPIYMIMSEGQIANATIEQIEHIRHEYQPREAVIVQSDARMFYHIVHYYLPQYEGYLLQQTMSPPRPSLAFPSPVRLADSVSSVILLNPKARVRPEPQLVELRTDATVGVVRIGPEARYMHFDGTGVRFAANP